jgi:hypothetical protein
MDARLARDALKTIQALRRRVHELEIELAKSRGTTPADKSGLKGAIADSTRRGLPNSFAVPGADTANLIDKAAKRSRKS